NGLTVSSGSLTVTPLNSAGIVTNTAAGVLGSLLNSSGVNGNVLTLAGGVPVWQAPAGGGGGNAIYGDGSDGTTSGLGCGTVATMTLTRDIYCSSLTVPAGVTLTTWDARIFVTGTATINGTLQMPGTPASGKFGGGAGAAGTMGFGGTGGTGGVGAVGTAGGAANPGQGGNGGAGGTSGGFAGGAAGAGAGGAGTKAGGGGGAGGGVIMLIYNTNLYTGATNGSGGAGGAKVGTGVAGSPGAVGFVIQFQN